MGCISNLLYVGCHRHGAVAKGAERKEECTPGAMHADMVLLRLHGDCAWRMHEAPRSYHCSVMCEQRSTVRSAQRQHAAQERATHRTRGVCAMLRWVMWRLVRSSRARAAPPRSAMGLRDRSMAVRCAWPCANYQTNTRMCCLYGKVEGRGYDGVQRCS